MDFNLIANIGSNYEYFKSYLKNKSKFKKFNGKNNKHYNITVYPSIIKTTTVKKMAVKIFNSHYCID